MKREEALARAALLVERYRLLGTEPEPAATAEFVRIVLAPETGLALAVLADTTGLDRFASGQEIRPGELDFEATEAFGWVQFLRARVLPAGQNATAWEQAWSALYLTYQHDPARVPDETLATFIDESPGHALLHGSWKLEEYERSGDEEALFLAVILLEGAVPTIDTDDPERDAWLHRLVAGYFTLSQHHARLYQQTRQPDQLDRAIEAARRGVANSPEAGWPQLADQLSDCLRLKAEADGARETIEEAVDLSRRAVSVARARGEVRPRFLSRLSVALRVAYEISSDLGRIDEAVDYGRQAVEHTPTEDVNWPARANNLASALSLRFKVTARSSDIDEAIDLYTRVVSRQHPDEPDPGMGYSNLGEALRVRFLPTTDATGLGRAVEAGRRAVAVTPPQHVHYGLYCGNLSLALLNLMTLTGNDSLIEEALSMARAALEVTPPGHPEYPNRLAALAGALLECYRSTDDTLVLDECADITRRGVAAVPPSHPDYSGVIYNYAAALRAQFRRTGERAYLTKAVDALREASGTVTSTRFGRAEILRGLVNAWREAIAEKAASLEDLSRLLPVIRGYLETAEHGSAEHAELLVALSEGLCFLYQLDPRPELLDEAVDTASVLATDAGQHHIHLTDYLIAQSEPFLRLFESCGDPVALDEAIRILRHAHALLAGLDQSRAQVALRLCSLLTAAVGFQGPTALTDAIRFGREAVELLPSGSPRQLSARTALSGALQDHANRTGSKRHLEEALRISRALVRETQSGTDQHDRCAFDLALGLQIQARLEDDPRHLDEAIRIFRALTEDLQVDDVRRSRRFFHLGRLHHDRYAATGEPTDLQAAIAALGRAARFTNASPMQRLSAARQSGELNAECGNWEAATDDYAVAIDQLPFAIGPRLAREAQEALLSQTTGVALAAAACTLELGDPLRAVRLLEAGRATLIAQALDLRGPLSGVAERAPHLAAQWQQLREESSVSGPETLVQRHQRAARWAGLRNDLRALPDVGDMLAPLSHQALANAAAEGAVVVVNSHASRTDAIVISGNDIDALRLPVTEEDVGRAANELLRIQPGVRAGGGAEQHMFEILEWLWDNVTQPVLHALGLDAPCAPEQAPRLWWCPTGVFTFLPLGAAGHHGSCDTVLDYAVSSFIPTIRALAHARRPRSTRTDGFLGVAVPDVPGRPLLPGVPDEIEFLRDRFPAGAFLSGPHATEQQVLARLVDADRVHFACHGTSDPYSPSNSSLILHGGTPLRASQVSRIDMDADLAFLSACSTAQGGYTLPDEAITLASSFLLAGYRNVIATLWPIYDAEAPRIAKDFYESLAATTGPARSLHQAIHHARERHPRRPDVWSSYVHYGA
ncbi:CHAT domain-containing protein [Streptomyces sp. NPDC046727]|uniref:CHAT domain-containing protein n=1 Tax=Streptomyces sp. NPDC046727 TaxID=3155373 RepID=UPI00340C5CDB